MGVETEMYGPPNLQHPGFYRGVVEDINDPEKAGRVRIRILGIHSDNKTYVKTQDLPWAIPATSIGVDGGGLRNIGNFKVPDIGSQVFLFFEAEDHNFPVYFAAAPAIEDVEDYQQKNGKLNEEENEYEYDDSSRYDDKSNFSEDVDQYETKKDDQIEHPVQDWAAGTRKNIFGDGGEASIPPPRKNEVEAQPIFPTNFFITDIRVAFDGKSNHDAPNYNGIHTTKPSSILNSTQEEQELDLWSERKWGYNDDDAEHQHNWEGGVDWTPEYPMTCTSRNAQGEIVDLDILKERRTYIHPSKYFIELIQLDSSRQRDDFLNESSVKRVYERQRGVCNSPSESSSPKEGTIAGFVDSNQSDPIINSDEVNNDRVNNEITYDDIDGGTRNQRVSRFEERKHNPGREKTIVEDFVYRFFMSKVNETFQQDRNARIYVGNDNLEIEHGDRNYRLHRGSHNQHLDEGNYSRIVNKGWEHLHVDEGHHFIEIGGENLFETSGFAEDVGNPDYEKNQHENLATEDENSVGNQFFLLHKGNQKFKLLEGNQKFELLDGNMERDVEGERITRYSGNCTEETESAWEWTAANGFTFNGDITINGSVTISSALTVNGISDFTGGHQGGNLDGH